MIDLRPEFISPRNRPVHETSFLDGLRGFSAFLVYIAHNILSANGVFTNLEVGFGYRGEYKLITAPWLRLFFTGSHVAVAIFFVISGFVLSRGPLTLIRDERYAELSGSLASALCRRAIRLYVPVIGSTFAFMTAFHLLGIKPEYGLFKEFYAAEVVNYIRELWHWTYVFRSKNKGYFTDHGKVREGWFDYNAHTWTIPIEVQGSIIVWIAILAMSRTTSRKRMTALCIASAYFLIQGSWFTCTFLMGAVLAEQDLMRQSKTRNEQVYWIVFIIGTYLAGPPAMGLVYMSHDMLGEHPGWYYISRLIPWVYYDCTHFIYSIAAIMIVASIIAIPTLRRLFEGTTMQYLGRISFALYLVHGPVLASLGNFMYQVVGKKVAETPSQWQNTFPIPQIGPTGIDLAFWIPHVILLPVTLYLSELCTKLFDEPSIRIARECYRRLLE